MATPEQISSKQEGKSKVADLKAHKKAKASSFADDYYNTDLKQYDYTDVKQYGYPTITAKTYQGTINSSTGTINVPNYKQAEIEFDPRPATKEQILQFHEALPERLGNMLADLFDGMGLSDETLDLLAQRLSDESLDTIDLVLREQNLELAYRRRPAAPIEAAPLNKVGGRRTYGDLTITNTGSSNMKLSNTFVVSDGSYVYSCEISLAVLAQLSEDDFARILDTQFRSSVKAGMARKV